jgi:hypothetical protein
METLASSEMWAVDALRSMASNSQALHDLVHAIRQFRKSQKLDRQLSCGQGMSPKSSWFSRNPHVGALNMFIVFPRKTCYSTLASPTIYDVCSKGSTFAEAQGNAASSKHPNHVSGLICDLLRLGTSLSSTILIVEAVIAGAGDYQNRQ